MVFLNFAASVLSFVIGVLLFVNANSAIHEGVGALFMTCSAVFFAGGSICYRIACFKDEFVRTASRVESRLLQAEQPVSVVDPESPAV